MDAFDFTQLLVDYCSGSCSSEEKEMIDRWLDSVVENHPNEWEDLSQTEKQRFMEDVFAKIKSTVSRP